MRLLQEGLFLPVFGRPCGLLKQFHWQLAPFLRFNLPVLVVRQKTQLGRSLQLDGHQLG